MSALAPHPWDQYGAPPPPSATYEEVEPPVVKRRRYFLTFEYEATVDVVDTDALSDADIEAALSWAHADDVRDHAWRDSVFVSEIEGEPKGEPDYTVRIVDGRAETVS